MLQIFSNNLTTLVLNDKTPERNIERVNEHIRICNCKNMTVDISAINVMDACMIATMCSTTHYLKYPDGSINWIINSQKVEEYTKPMNLGNSKYVMTCQNFKKKVLQ